MITINYFTRPRWLYISAALAWSAAQAENTENPADLLSRLQAIQQENRIEISGLNHIGQEENIIASGNPEQQLQQLLAGYNHIISKNARGHIERVIIIDKKQSPDSRRIVLPLVRESNRSVVSILISGNGKTWLNLDMVIDTGADLMVLPDSMIDELSMTNDTFIRRKLQTANGLTDARIGLLQAVKIGHETLENVEAAFVADALLAGNSLLGMNVLGQFKLTIDDKQQLVTLLKK